MIYKQNAILLLILVLISSVITLRHETMTGSYGGELGA